MNRRDFLGVTAALAAASCAPFADSLLPPGDILGADADFGHRLREGKFPPASETRRHEVLIVGGGIAGLSAAWKLNKAGAGDLLVCELESRVGGNARWGENAASAYPWGAHYLPLPGRDCRAVRELLAEFGVLRGDPAAERPTYDERYLSASPQERLFRDGVWHAGTMPQARLTAAELSQARRFAELMQEFKKRRGADGRKAFTLPLEYSSRDPALLALDRKNMRDWLLAQGFDSVPLHWYVDYACRDDFGTRAAETSAWAGIHYFACRDGEATNADSDIVLTAPEGNGWIVRRLEEKLAAHLQTGAMCLRIRDEGKRVVADVYLRGQDRTLRIEAKQLIWSAPAFLLPRVWPDAPAPLLAAARDVDYAPWLVANLTLARLPEERGGAPLSWDNVLYDSGSLGYVVATHQTLRTRPGPTVFTYYRALCDGPSALARRRLLETPREVWAADILRELERVHPDIREIALRADLCRFGHAMARPRPGSLWHGRRALLARGHGRVQLAHADLSGMSVFEEANYRGVMAAEQVLRRLGVSFASSL
jgi:monoamine oxidase